MEIIAPDISSYRIRRRHTVTDAPFFHTRVLHDGENPQQILEKQFQHACGLFAGEIIQLTRTDRALTMEKQENFTSALDGLLQLHTTLRQDKK